MNSPPTSVRPRRGVRFSVAFVVGLFATPLIGLAFALSGFMPVDAGGTPPQWESAIGQHALEVSLARRSEDFVDPTKLVDPTREPDADLIAGMNTYRNDCAGCHGDYGQKRSGSGLYPPVPQFNQRPPGLTAPEMFVAVKYGIRYSGMGAWNEEITDKEIWQTVGFLRHLNSLPPAVNEAWKAKHQ
jgi:mono/diheme cytochrome c family protein